MPTALQIQLAPRGMFHGLDILLYDIEHKIGKIEAWPVGIDSSINNVEMYQT